MRALPLSLSVAVVLVLAGSSLATLGCTESNPDYDPQFAGSGDGGGGGSHDLAGVLPTLDLAATHVADLAISPPDLNGGEGAHCNTACDCTAPLACFNGSCIKSNFGPVYCCSAMNCPYNQYCQDDKGNFNRCGGGGGNPPPPDMSMGVGPMYCMFIPCTNDMICQQSGCVQCNMTAKHCE